MLHIEGTCRRSCSVEQKRCYMLPAAGWARAARWSMRADHDRRPEDMPLLSLVGCMPSRGLTFLASAPATAADHSKGVCLLSA